MKIKAIKWILGSLVIFSATSFASTIIDSGPAVKKHFDTNPNATKKAIQITDLNTWARCVNVYISTMAMEVRGHKWESRTAITFALLGEAMGRVRVNFLSQGYKEDILDKLLKTYTIRQVEVSDMKFCNEHINKIVE